ncbi:hypothetical protein GWC77_04090 [Paraburkholderia sp. NMBU_R16]|uniref:hypothetical protein n=1 Tax=Paraburkholderia sp. NMBU_R16 TaxID=2698676 RepID=UPI001565D092|nr:hypothetical protein [Paraburkholderia sp. NMBU_R16]NRO95122.1 hypothetical protein [Paraburkholderia sp. NMBU_R16]
MGLSISRSRSGITGDDISPPTGQPPADTPGQRGSRFAASRSAVLSGLSPRAAARPDGRLPYEVAVAVGQHLDLDAQARLAMTGRATLGLLPHVRERIATIKADAESEIQVFANPQGAVLDAASPALGRITELPKALRVEIVDRAVAEYKLPDADVAEAIEPLRARFALLCEHVAALHDHPRFPILASQLATNALAETYRTGNDWAHLNTGEALQQVLPLLERLRERDRHRLAKFLRRNIVLMLRVADRADALNAISQAAGPRRGPFCGLLRN